MNPNNSEVPQVPIIVNPNLGRPIFLSTDRRLKMKEFKTELLFISSILDSEEFEEQIKDNIKLS
ncbi:MAG: hypothetical protein ACW99L_12645, partial [Promethearchaeota archaeon]